MENDAPGSDFGVFANFDPTQDFCTCSDHHSGADDGVAGTCVLAGASKGHFMKDRDVVFNNGRLTDHERGGMVQKNSAADSCGGMDVHAENLAGKALEVEREIFSIRIPELVTDAVGAHAQKSLVVEKGLDGVGAGRIPVVNREKITRDSAYEGGVREEGIAKDGEQLSPGHVLPREFPREPGRQGAGEVTTGLEEIGNKDLELRLSLSNLRGLLAKEVPKEVEAGSPFGTEEMRDRQHF